MPVLTDSLRGNQVCECSSCDLLGGSGTEWSKKRNHLLVFPRSGVLDESLNIVSREHEDQDPFDELYSGHFISATDELKDLICQVRMPSEVRCSVNEYINGDYLPTCSEGDEM